MPEPVKTGARGSDSPSPWGGGQGMGLGMEYGFSYLLFGAGGVSL